MSDRSLVAFLRERVTRLGGDANSVFLIVWVGLLLVAHWDVVGLYRTPVGIAPVESFFFEADQTVPLLHYVAFAVVAWNRRYALVAASPSWTASVAALLAGGLGIAAFVWARSTAQLDLLVDSLVLLVVAGGLWRAGWRALDVLVLPLAIVWLARPWPPMVLHALHDSLQYMTGSFADFVLTPFGDVVRSGHYIHFGGQGFVVIEGCSGLRSTLTTVFAALCYADFVSRSRRQTLGLVAAAVVIGLGVNGFRVVWIMLMHGASLSPDHSVQGLVMISVGIVVLGLLDAAADRTIWPRGDRTWRRSKPARPVPALDRRAWALLCVCGTLALASVFPIARKPPAGTIWRLHEIRREMGPWGVEKVLEMDHDHIGSIDFRDHFHRIYTDGDDRVRLFVGANDPRRRDQSGFSPKTRVSGNAWQIVEITTMKLPGSGRDVERVRQRVRSTEALAFHFRIGIGSLMHESLKWYLALDHRSGGTPTDSLVVRVTTRIREGQVPQAQAVLMRFMQELEKDLERASPRVERN